MKSDRAKEQRHRQIHELIVNHGQFAAEELARRLAVTGMTIRRDLDEMQEAGLLLRVHGGAVLAKPFIREQSFSEKAAQHLAEKRAIALEAVRMLAPDVSLYLDTGTTAAMVAQLLPVGLNLRVYTNNLRAVMDLFGREDVAVHVYGGTLMPRNPDLTGADAVERITCVRTDVALLGADAVDPDSGQIFGADAETAVLSRLAQRQSRRQIFLVDSSKFSGARGQHVVARLVPPVTLVTDGGVSGALRRKLRKLQVEVIYARMPEPRTDGKCSVSRRGTAMKTQQVNAMRAAGA